MTGWLKNLSERILKRSRWTLNGHIPLHRSDHKYCCRLTTVSVPVLKKSFSMGQLWCQHWRIDWLIILPSHITYSKSVQLARWKLRSIKFLRVKSGTMIPSPGQFFRNHSSNSHNHNKLLAVKKNSGCKARGTTCLHIIVR